eukprot:GILJ01002627.1.p1 GENE.GILJ01002627.1~~GILJ01002627.1.p1  ORF type:complete len:273 (+),score=54.41 GILJ01002627.1:74-820(+)
MVSQDPFVSFRDDVESSMKRLTASFEQWKELLQNTNTAKDYEFNAKNEELQEDIKDIEADLAALNDAVVAAERDRARFKLDSAELDNRRGFVANSRQIVRNIKETLSSPTTLAKIEKDKREQLLQRSKPVDSKISRAKSAIEESNEHYMRSQQQQQELLVHQQDQTLDVLAQSADRLIETSKAINVELDVHRRMIDDLSTDVDRAADNLNFVMKKVTKLLGTSDKGKIWTIFFLIVVMIILFVLVVYV